MPHFSKHTKQQELNQDQTKASSLFWKDLLIPACVRGDADGVPLWWYHWHRVLWLALSELPSAGACFCCSWKTSGCLLLLPSEKHGIPALYAADCYGALISGCKALGARGLFKIFFHNVDKVEILHPCTHAAAQLKTSVDRFLLKSEKSGSSLNVPPGWRSPSSAFRRNGCPPRHIPLPEPPATSPLISAALQPQRAAVLSFALSFQSRRLAWLQAFCP